MERKPNRLVKEKSPYLLQHAFNPVDWYPWSGEALKRAKNDSKPIFLSIGYSTCHWCHVFEKESFEDAQTAAFINKNFIPIKVDREERPELDAYYMAAVQTLTGGGGWPLTVFLTPDLKPFYGGTYFPKEPRYGIPSFMQVLEFVSKLWKEKRSEVVGNSEQVSKAISAGLSPRGNSEPGKPLLDEAYRAIVSSFDPEHGGFGGAPKFPLPMTLAFLLRDHFRTGRELALRSALKTLDSMMAGGIRDHIGGGFHRYSTDRHWLVPHFEKMLYDNALLARVYLEAFQATGNEGYALVARETLGWILEEMTDPEGGFYSAQDADTPEGEGVYYTWTPAEVQKVLGPKHSAAFNDAFGVTKTGNFEGRTILHFANVAALQEVDEGLKSKLYLARLKRPRPPTDTKVLTSWNGLAISAFALSGAIRGGKPHLQAAEKAARFVLHKVSKDGRLQRRYAGGEAALDGTLEDYAFFVQGLLDLFEATGDPEWLEQAVRLTDAMSRDFRDEEGEGFFMTMEAAPVRIKEAYDGPTPSGNSVAALNLLRISELTGRDAYRAEAEKVLKYFGKDLEEQPSGHAAMLMALDLLLNGMREVVITSRFEGGAAEMTREVFRRFLPDKVVLVASASTYEELSRLSGLLEGRRPTSKARAYVCKDNACKLPADTVEALSVQLAEPRITV